MQDYIDSRLYYFLLDEYHYNENEGANSAKMIESYEKLLEDGTLRDTIKDLDIFDNISTFDNILDFFKGSSRDSYQGNLGEKDREEYLDKIYSKLELDSVTQKILFIPIVLSKHAISIMIHKTGKNSHSIYFMNSGKGIKRHVIKISDTITNEAIYMKSGDDKLLKYFLGFMTLSNDIDTFYNTAIHVLTTKNIYATNNEIETYMDNSEIFQDSNMFEVQLIGSCTFRTVYLGTYNYLVNILGNDPNVFNNFITVLRLYIIKQFIDDYKRDPKENLEQTYHFTKDIFSRVSENIFSDNDQIISMVDEILKTIFEINNKKPLFNGAQVNYGTIQNTISYKRNEAIDIIINSSQTIYYDQELLGYIDNRKSKIIKKFEGFMVLKNFDKQIEYFNSYNNNNILSTHFVDIVPDIKSIFDLFEINNIDGTDEILTPDSPMLLQTLNNYLKNIFKDIEIPVNDDYRFLTNYYHDFLIGDYSSYQIFMKSIKKILDNYYLGYLVKGDFIQCFYSQIKKKLDDIHNDFFQKNPNRGFKTKDIYDTINTDKLKEINIPKSEFSELSDNIASCIINCSYYGRVRWINNSGQSIEGEGFSERIYNALSDGIKNSFNGTLDKIVNDITDHNSYYYFFDDYNDKTNVFMTFVSDPQNNECYNDQTENLYDIVTYKNKVITSQKKLDNVTSQYNHQTKSFTPKIFNQHMHISSGQHGGVGEYIAKLNTAVTPDQDFSLSNYINLFINDKKENTSFNPKLKEALNVPEGYDIIKFRELIENLMKLQPTKRGTKEEIMEKITNIKITKEDGHKIIFDSTKFLNIYDFNHFNDKTIIGIMLDDIITNIIDKIMESLKNNYRQYIDHRKRFPGSYPEADEAMQILEKRNFDSLTSNENKSNFREKLNEKKEKIAKIVIAMLSKNVIKYARNQHREIKKLSDQFKRKFEKSVRPDSLFSNQSNMSFLMHQIVIDFHREVRFVKDMKNIIPNIYLLDIEKREKGTMIGGEFNQRDFNENLRGNLDMGEKEASNLISEIKKCMETRGNGKIIQQKEKISLILLYLVFFINTNAGKIVSYYGENIGKILDEIRKMDPRTNTFCDIVESYSKLKHVQSLTESKYLQIVLFNQGDIIDDDVLSDCVYEKIVFDVLKRLEKSETQLGSQIISQIETHKIFNEFISDRTIKQLGKYFQIEKIAKVGYSSHDLAYNVSLTIDPSHSGYTKLIIKNKKPTHINPTSSLYDFNTNKYICYLVNNQNQQHRILEIGELKTNTSYIYDNFIVLETQPTELKFIKLNPNIKFELAGTINDNSVIINGLFEDKIGNDIVRYNTKLIDDNSKESILNSFLIMNIDIIEDIFLFKVDNGDKIHVIFPNLDLQLKIHGNEMFYSDMRVMNRDQQFYYLTKKKQNLLILQNDKSGQTKILYPNHYSFDAQKNHNIPLSLVPVNLNKLFSRLEIPVIKSTTHKDAFYNGDRIFSEYTQLDLKYEGSIKEIYYEDFEDIMKLYFVASCGQNYPLQSVIFKYLCKGIRFSQINKYIDYLKGDFPFAKLLYLVHDETIPKITGWTLASLLITNIHIPSKYRFTKATFDFLDGNNVPIHLIQEPLKMIDRSHDLTQIQLYSLSKSIKALMTQNKLDEPTKLRYTRHESNSSMIMYNYLCRLSRKKLTINDFSYFSPDYADRFLEITSPGKTVKEKKDEYVYEIVDVSYKLNYVIVHLEKLEEYLITDITTLLDSVDIKQEYFEEIDYVEKFRDELKNYTSRNYNYTLRNKDRFRNKAKNLVMDKYKKITIILQEYTNVEHIIDELDNIKNYTGDAKICEMLFFKTLQKRYDVLLYKLGFDVNGSPIETKYDLDEFINIFMGDLEKIPGYIQKKKDEQSQNISYYMKVNSLIIFFEHFFSDINYSKDKLSGGSGSIITKDQYKLISSILDSECNIKTEHSFYQLIMGAGKSSYIAPLLSLLLIAIGKYPIHVMPKVLVPQSLENMNILNMFGIKNINKNIERSSIHEKIYSFDEIKGTNKENINYIFSDGDVKSILLNNVQKNNHIVYKNLIDKLEHGFLIFDEVDDISDPFSCELNYPYTNSIQKVEMMNNKIDFFMEIIQLFAVKDIREKLDIKTHESYESYKSSAGSDYNIYFIEGDVNTEEFLTPKFGFMKKIINDFIQIPIIDNIKDIADENIFKNKIGGLDLSGYDEKQRKITIRKIDVMYNFVFKILPVVLRTKNRKEYGLVNEIGKIAQKNNLIAIPFSGVENPSYKSDFSDNNITLAYTILSYFSNKMILREYDFDVLLDDLYQYYQSVNEKYWRKTQYKTYKEIVTAITGTIVDELNIEEYHSFESIKNMDQYHTIDQHHTIDQYKVISLRIKILNGYMKGICERLMREHKYQLNSTFSDIVTSDFCINRTGFTGTPYLTSQFDRIEKKSLRLDPIDDPSAQMSIFYSLLNKKVQVKTIGDDSEKIFEILNADGCKYSTLIDVGAYFVGDKNIDVAKKLLRKCARITDVLFLDDNNKQVIINREHLLDHNKKSFPINKLPKDYTIQNIFVYFDQKHITGIDVKVMPHNAKGLVTLKYNTIIRDYGQGTYRLRKINMTQSIDICIDKSLSSIVNLSTMSQPETKKKLFELLLHNQDNRNDNKYKLQCLHNIRTIFRYHLMNKGNMKIFLSKKIKALEINVMANQVVYSLATEIKDVGKQLYERNIEEAKYIVHLLKKHYNLDNSLSNKLRKLLEKIESTLDMSIVGQIEAVQETIQEKEEQEEEYEELLKNKIHIEHFQQYNNIFKSYNINDIITMSSIGNVEDPNSYTRTLINLGYSDKVYVTKLFIYTNYCLRYNEKSDQIKIPEFCYRLIYNELKNSFIIVTPEEYEHIRSVIKNNDIKGIKLVKYHKIDENGIHSLIDYMTDRVIINHQDITYMINNYIKNIAKFKENSFKYDSIVNRYSGAKNARFEKKMHDENLYKLVLCKENYGGINFINSASQINVDINRARQIEPIRMIDTYLDYFLISDVSIVEYILGIYKNKDTMTEDGILINNKTLDKDHLDFFKELFSEIITKEREKVPQIGGKTMMYKYAKYKAKCKLLLSSNKQKYGKILPF